MDRDQAFFGDPKTDASVILKKKKHFFLEGLRQKRELDLDP